MFISIESTGFYIQINLELEHFTCVFFVNNYAIKLCGKLVKNYKLATGKIYNLYDNSF